MSQNGSCRFKAITHSVAAFLCFLLVVGIVAAEQTKKTTTRPSTQQSANAKDTLSLANFYYSSNDTSDLAAKQYRSVVTRYPSSKEAEAAQYYLASYYHRKYYIRKERWQSDHRDSLRQAEVEYKAYINRYSKAQSPEWLSDARFNLSLAFMEQGDFVSAKDQLDRIILYDSKKDPLVYIHQVIWSGDPNDVIDKNVNAKELAERTRPIAMVQQSGQGIDAVVPYLREWCRTGKK